MPATPTAESTPTSSNYERTALRWLANRLRWEATLDAMRSTESAAADKAA